MIVARSADVDTVSVTAIQEKPVFGGELQVKPLLQSEAMMLMEIHYAPGVGAPLHVHTHESMTYVVKGKVRMLVGDVEYVLGPGDACRHPSGVAHCVEAIEESVMIEVKSPAPVMSSLFKLTTQAASQ